jgi:hypothetical protein
MFCLVWKRALTNPILVYLSAVAGRKIRLEHVTLLF